MPLVVNTNVASINAQNSLTRNTGALNRSLERLSSGYRINRAADDAAGLQISEILRTQIRGEKKALDNVQDGIGILKTMDGAFNTIINNIQRIRELTVQAANDTNTTVQRAAVEQEVTQLSLEITRISDTMRFNSAVLLNGSVTNFIVQVGANAGQFINLATAVTGVNPFGDIDATILGIANLDYDSASGITISSLLATIDTALSTATSRRSAIGALTNRLESTAENLMYSIENNSNSESRIRDLDVAQESGNMVKNQILQQASASILSQANQTPQLALTLLQGG